MLATAPPFENQVAETSYSETTTFTRLGLRPSVTEVPYLSSKVLAAAMWSWPCFWYLAPLISLGWFGPSGRYRAPEGPAHRYLLRIYGPAAVTDSELRSVTVLVAVWQSVQVVHKSTARY
jgi:hypothetical protein